MCPESLFKIDCIDGEISGLAMASFELIVITLDQIGLRHFINCLMLITVCASVLLLQENENNILLMIQHFYLDK